MPDDAPDPSFDALLADPRMALRRPPPHVSLTDLRRAANAFQARAPKSEVASVADHVVLGPGGPITVRLYRPTIERTAAILFCHGGGFILGNLDTHDAMCRTLANSSGRTVVAVDYRLAPEHPFPAALDDAQAALEWLRREARSLDLDPDPDPDRIAVAGDSAGGHIALGLALRCRDEDIPLDHIGLIYPLLDPAGGSASAVQFAQGYMLTASFLEWAWNAYRGEGVADPWFDLTHADLHGLPPTTIVTAQFDPLRDEGEALARRLGDAEVDVALRRHPGMIHGFAGLPQLTPVANEAIAFIAARIAASQISAPRISAAPSGSHRRGE
jgi:acetyl esterase